MNANHATQLLSLAATILLTTQICLPGLPQALAQERSEYDAQSLLDSISLSYYGQFFGPSLESPTSYQPKPNGGPDRSKPLLMKNYLALGYILDENLALNGTAYWTWVPVLGQRVDMQDPYLRLSHDSLFSGNGFNLYADLRIHFPISEISREIDMLAGFQSFQVLSYTPPDSRFTVGTYSSIRTNIFGTMGAGYDLELYLGPNIAYQLSPKLAFTLLYEMGASHIFGTKAFELVNDGTNIQPGLSWDITPQLNFSPYLNIFPSGRISLQSTSFGFGMSWFLI